MTYKVWWLGGSDGAGNFGDVLTPMILDHFSIDYEYVSHYGDADIISVGSIARRAGQKTMVLGSGIISKSDKMTPWADWRFVRGPYTRDRIIQLGGECPEIYGDPGLLLPLIVPPADKKYKVGVIPHIIDYAEIKEANPTQNVISLRTKDCREVIKRITECEYIVSSSLHGIICAHAYGIPAAWVQSKNKLKGDNVKFEDYYASVNLTPQLSTYENPVFTVPATINVDLIVEIFNNLK